MTGAIKKHLRKQQLRSGGSIGSPSPTSSSGAEEASSPPQHQFQRSKTGSWVDSPAVTPLDGASLAKSRRPMAVDRTPSFSGHQESDVMELRKELLEKGDELLAASRRCQDLQDQLHKEREGRQDSQATKCHLSSQAQHLQQELQEKTLLLNQHEEFLRKLQAGEGVEASIQELLESCKLAGSRAAERGAANGTGTAGFDSPRADRLAAAERENTFYEREVERLRGQVESLQREKEGLHEQVEHMRRELELSRSREHSGEGSDGRNGGGEGDAEDLRVEVERLRQDLEEVKEDKEATVTELLSQVMALNSKLQLARKEREAAVVAAERKVEVMKRELASVLDRNEKNEADVERARVSILKSEEYLKALDVARVEVKRLRLERDLLVDKLRSAEETMRKKGMTGVDLTSWLMPNCLLQREADEPKFVPDTPSR